MVALPRAERHRDRGRQLSGGVRTGEEPYFLSQTGVLSVVTAAKGLEVLQVAQFAEPCYATPALEDGRIWVRTAGKLYCFGASGAR